MTITKDTIIAIVGRNLVDHEGVPIAIMAHVAADILAAEEVVGRRREIDGMLTDEHARHAEILRVIASQLQELQASCPHPATELRRGALYCPSCRACVLCGAEVAGK